MFRRLSPPTIFPIYLLPSIPFRRRKTSTSSTDSSTSTSSASSTDPNNSSEPPYLTGHISHLRCTTCSTDICLTSQIVSKGFTGRHGRAYLVSPNDSPKLANTKTDAPSSRQLVTGVHTVSDVRCVICNSMLGWKYEGAEEESQRYKVGKYILETKCVGASSNWEMPPLSLGDGGMGGDGQVEFDSQDEDECEDLFAGVWTRELAVKRRQGKRFRRMEGGEEGGRT